MSTQHIHQVIEEARQKINAGDLEGYLETLYAPGATFYFLPPPLPPTLDGARLFYAGFMAAFPGMQLIFDDVIVEGDRLAARYHVDMTHAGDFQGIPATGKRVRLDGISIMRIEDDKVVERWNEGDFLGLMQQLGAIPASEGA